MAMNLEQKKDLALLYWRQGYERQVAGDLDGAIGLYRRSVAVHPTAEGHTFLGWAYGQQGRLEEAIAECRTAIALDPEYGNPYNDLGVYLMEQGRLVEAAGCLEQAASSSRYDCPFFAHFNLGRLYERQGQWLKAMAEYRLALELQPDYRNAETAIHRLGALLN
jgi:tetratricopeptide (TPR) repeat protein